MPTTTITDLPPASTVTGTELLIVDQDTSTYKLSLGEIFKQGGSETLTSISFDDQTGILSYTNEYGGTNDMDISTINRIDIFQVTSTYGNITDTFIAENLLVGSNGGILHAYSDAIFDGQVNFEGNINAKADATFENGINVIGNISTENVSAFSVGCNEITSSKIQSNTLIVSDSIYAYDTFSDVFWCDFKASFNRGFTSIQSDGNPNQLVYGGSFLLGDYRIADSSTLIVDGIANFNNGTNFNGTTNFTGTNNTFNKLTVSEQTSLSGTTYFQDSLQFYSAPQFFNGFATNGNVTFDFGDISISSNFTQVSGNFTFDSNDTVKSNSDFEFNNNSKIKLIPSSDEIQASPGQPQSRQTTIEQGRISIGYGAGAPLTIDYIESAENDIWPLGLNNQFASFGSYLSTGKRFNLVLGKSSLNADSAEFGGIFIGTSSGDNSPSIEQNSILCWDTDNQRETFSVGADTGDVEHLGNITQTSDYRVKENVNPLQDSTEIINSLNPVNYNIKDREETTAGFIAHEVQEIVPHLVKGEKDGDDYQSVNYVKVVPYLVKALQEANARITELEKLVSNK